MSDKHWTDLFDFSEAKGGEAKSISSCVLAAAMFLSVAIISVSSCQRQSNEAEQKKEQVVAMEKSQNCAKDYTYSQGQQFIVTDWCAKGSMNGSTEDAAVSRGVTPASD